MFNCDYMDNSAFYNNDNMYNGMTRNEHFEQMYYDNYLPCGCSLNNVDQMRNSCPYMDNNDFYQYSPLVNSINPYSDVENINADFSEIKMRSVPIEEIRD